MKVFGEILGQPTALMSLLAVWGTGVGRRAKTLWVLLVGAI